MLHLKNIAKANPKTAEQYQLTRDFGVEWLFSEDGKNWYEEQKNFSPDTIKIAYLPSGQVFAVEKDVTGLNPEGMSVLELPDITANRRINDSGFWFYRDESLVYNYALKAKVEREERIKTASSAVYDLEQDLLLGLISDEDKEKLRQSRLYVRALRNLELTTITDKTSFNAIQWPQAPDLI